MKSVVITGSTRGIGRGLADSFLARGCSVTISGRSEERLAAALSALRLKHDAERLLGVRCDVRDPEQVEALWEGAAARFGRVDIWINNAGTSGAQGKVWLRPPVESREVVETNLLGLIYGSQVAVRGMLRQGSGSIYNMEGMGSDGRRHDGLLLYGTTKYGLRYFTKGLAEETRGTPLVIGSISPGMVVTDMLWEAFQDRPEEWERAKRIFNIIANRIEDISPWIVERVLNNEKSGVRFAYLSRLKLLLRFLAAPFRRRDLFQAEGPEP